MGQHLRLGITLALVAALIYGAVPNFARLAFLNGIPALETVLYRTFSVAVVLAIVAVLRSESFRMAREAWPAFLFQCLATLLVSSCYLASIQFLPVTLSVIIFYLFPVMVLLASPLLEGRSPGLLRIAVSLVAFAGLWIAVGPAFDQVRPIGLVLAFLGAVGCAVQFFSGRMLSQHLEPAAFGSLVHVAIFPIILALALWFGDGQFKLAGAAQLGPYAGLAVAGACIAYVGGYFFHMSAVKAAPSSVVAPYFNLEPIVSTGIAVLLLKEHMTQSQWIGGGLVFAALVLTSLLGRSWRVKA
jgi:drug/metabolite transporter (DMT)-like permease